MSTSIPARGRSDPRVSGQCHYEAARTPGARKSAGPGSRKDAAAARRPFPMPAARPAATRVGRVSDPAAKVRANPWPARQYLHAAHRSNHRFPAPCKLSRTPGRRCAPCGELPNRRPARFHRSASAARAQYQRPVEESPSLDAEKSWGRLAAGPAAAAALAPNKCPPRPKIVSCLLLAT